MRSADPMVTVGCVARHHPAGAALRGSVTPGWPQWLAVTALVICGALVTLSISNPNDHGQRLLLAWVVSLPVVALRRWPLPVLAAVTIANALVMEDGSAPLPLGIILGVASYLAASRLPRRVSITAAAISAAALGGALIYADLTNPHAQVAVEAVQGFLPLAAGWFIGDSAAGTRPAWPNRPGNEPSRNKPPRPNAPASRSARSGCASLANCTTSWPTPSR